MEIEICLDSRLPSAETARLAVLAERSGIRGLWITCGIDMRDPFTNLAEAARTTSTLRLGAMAISPYELHPFRIAMALLTLNEIAGGRAAIGIGAGADVLGPARLVADRPVEHVRECLEIVKGATTRRPFTFEGEHYALRGYDPAWATAPPPEVHACAMAPRMLRMATGIADGVIVSDYTPALVAATVADVRALVAGHGRPPASVPVASFQPLYLARDLATARAQATRSIAWRALWRRPITRGFLDDAEFALLLEHMDALYAMAGRRDGPTSIPGLPDRIVAACVEELTLTAPLDDPACVVERLAAFRDAGLDRVALGIEHDPEQAIRVLGAHVVPAVA